MSKFVLDSSAILAFLFGEPGGEQVIDLAPDAYVSSVNMAEFYSKLSERSLDPEQALRASAPALAGVLPFTDGLARMAGRLRLQTRQFGLSLGDRACLATAVANGAAVYTSDRTWAQVSAGCPVNVIRA